MQEIFEIITRDKNEVIINGAMTFTTAARLAKALDEYIIQQEELIINLTGVKCSDSSALALIIHCYRFAQNRGKSVVFRAIPPALLEVAKLCGVEQILAQVNHE